MRAAIAVTEKLDSQLAQETCTSNMLSCVSFFLCEFFCTEHNFVEYLA